MKTNIKYPTIDKITGLLLIISLILMSAAACVGTNPLGSADETYTENLERTLDGAGVARLDAQTTNGQITLDDSSLDRVVVNITKVVRAPGEQQAKDFAEQVQVYVVRSGEEIRIYNEYTKPPSNVQVEVSYEIQSPSHMDVEFGTTNGGIQIRGIVGEVHAETTNGTVDVRGSADRVELRTTNGDIQATVVTLAEEGRFTTSNGSVDVEIQNGVVPITATTTNGSVGVALPSDFSGILDARTTNGSVSCEFPVSDVTGTPHRLTGSLGTGGNTRVTLQTTNGNVALKSHN